MTTTKDVAPSRPPTRPRSEFSLSEFDDIKRRIECDEIKAKRAVKRTLARWRECRRKTKIIQQVRKEITQ